MHTCVCEIVKTGKQRVSAEQRTYTDNLAQHKAGSVICLVQGGPVLLDVIPQHGAILNTGRERRSKCEQAEKCSTEC